MFLVFASYSRRWAWLCLLSICLAALVGCSAAITPVPPIPPAVLPEHTATIPVRIVSTAAIRPSPTVLALLPTHTAPEEPLVLNRLGVRPRSASSHPTSQIAFSPDGQWAATTLGPQVELWSLSAFLADDENGLVVLAGREAGTHCPTFGFSPDSRLLATCGDENEIWLYASATGQRYRTLVHSAGSDLFAFSPDSRLLAVASLNQSFLWIWDVESGSQIQEVKLTSLSRDLAFTTDGMQVITIEEGPHPSLVLYDAHTGALVRRILASDNFLRWVRVSPTGQTWAVADWSGRIFLLDGESGPQQELCASCGSISHIDFSPDGSLLFTANDDRRPGRVYSVELGQLVLEVDAPTWAGWLAVHPSGRLIAGGMLETGFGTWTLENSATTRLLPTRPAPTPTALAMPQPAGSDLLGRVGLGMVSSLALSTDGSQAVLSTSTGVYLYRTDSLEQVGTLAVSDLGNCAVYSPAGDVLAVGTYGGWIELFQAGSGERLRRFDGKGGPISGLAFSPDGSLLVSASENGQLRLWETATGTQRHRLMDANLYLYRPAFSPDGKYIAAGASDGSLSLFAVQDGRQEMVITGMNNPVTALAFSPDGRLLAGAAGALYFWEIPSGRQLSAPSTLTEGWITSLAFAPDGRTFAYGSDAGAINLWDIPGRKVTVRLQESPFEVTGLAFSPDGSLIYSAYRHGADALAAWHLRSQKISQRLPNFTPYHSHLQQGDQSLFLAAELHAGTAAGLWQVLPDYRLALRQTFVWEWPDCKPQVSDLALAWDANLLVVLYTGCGERLVVWDALVGKELRSLELPPDMISLLTLSPNGGQAAAAQYDGVVYFWNTQRGGRPLSTRSAGAPLSRLVYSPDGTRLAAAAEDGRVLAWDASSAQLLLDVNVSAHPLTALAFSPDGSQLAVGGRENALFILDSLTGETHIRRTLDQPLSALAYSPDGAQLAVSTGRQTVLWATNTFQPVLALDQSLSWVQNLAFGLDGSTLFIFGWDSSLTVVGLSSER